MPQQLTILGIEASCDETAAAVVQGDPLAGQGAILSNVIHDQIELHAPYGGVVPEIAARAHAEKLDGTVAEALARAGVELGQVDAIAVTVGPGLIGGLIAAVAMAQGLALGADKPLVAVNHLEGHVLTPRLTDGVAYPYLALLVSGGHCLFVIAHGLDDYERIGTTIDDAPGEAFDKVAKLLGLGYPGGPAVEAMARGGDSTRFALPRPLMNRPGCDLSFSGLKTAVRSVAMENERDPALIRDLCASFQAASADTLARKAGRALARFREDYPDVPPILAVVGGVAANGVLRGALEAICAENSARFIAPPPMLCTDNAAMIAWAGLERFAAGLMGTLSPRPRFPLARNVDESLWSGKRGAKV